MFPQDEVGALLSEDDLNFRQKAETTKPSLRWALPCARVFLMKEEVDALRTAIASARSLALSVVRVAKATGGGKGKSRAGKGDGDEGVPSFRGCASFPAASLMYPGVAEATAACLVSAPPAREADPAVKSKAKTAGDADKAEGAQYEAARTYAVISVCLRTPLVAKRTKAEMAARVASLVPPRPALPRVGESADKALADFHAKVAAIARDLLSRHRQMTGSDSGSSSQEVRQNLLYELNSSGRYAGFKEQLKRCVVSLVREKFRRTASLADVEDRQTFLNELYVYVVNEMHASLNAHFAFDYSYAPEPITMTAEQQQRLAAEAEAAGQLDSASELHKEALTNSPTDATVWYTAGLFYLRVGDTSQAEACLREAVALDQQHADALLFSAILAYEDRRPGEANTLLEGATAAAGDQPVVWCIRGLQHTRAGDDVSAELCAAHADTGKGLLLEAAEYLLRGGCLELAQRCEGLLAAWASGCAAPMTLSSHRSPTLGNTRCPHALSPSVHTRLHSALSAELIQRGRSVAYDTARVRYLLAIGDDKACSEAEALVQENISADYANPDLWALLGHTQYSKQPEAAMQSYQHALDLEADAKDIGTVTLRLAQLRLADDDFEAARDLFLQCCAASPSATAWKGAGIALYRLDELQEAEEALAEANVYNSSDAAVSADRTRACRAWCDPDRLDGNGVLWCPSCSTAPPCSACERSGCSP